MKQLQKLVTIVLAFVLALSLSLTALAATGSHGENVSEDSERAAYLAGYRILLGYGLSISISSGKKPKDEEEADAIRRGNCAADVYKAMIDPVT